MPKIQKSKLKSYVSEFKDTFSSDAVSCFVNLPIYSYMTYMLYIIITV